MTNLKSASLVVVGLAVVLGGMTLYLNRDAVKTQATKVFTQVSGGAGQSVKITIKEPVSVPTASVTPTSSVDPDEASLDKVFDVNESADNFDDLVQ
jgi:hypothetical protein